MKLLSRLIALVTLLLAAESIASPAQALKIQESWKVTMDNWTVNARNAITPEARAKVVEDRPDAEAAARQMWDIIGLSLTEDWTLEPAAWFLQITRNQITQNENGSSIPTFAAETEAIRKSVEADHLKSPNLIPMCMALAASGDPRSLSILEKIESGHPDKKTQGVAALGAAMILKNLGDNPDLARKRLTYLRKSIIDSSDVDLNGTTVAKLAENELYLIRYLAKGRVAPDISGVDAAGAPLRLSTMKGKVVLLMFWSSTNPESDRIIQMTNNMVNKFKGRPVVILGVNHDPLEKLRSMKSDSTVTWQNFSDPENKLADEYRVTSWPTVYVLDGERKIHYIGTQGTFAELTAEALLSEINP